LLTGRPRFDLTGEKELSWGWVAANIPHGTGRALDIGGASSAVAPILVFMGYKVICVDLKYMPLYELESFELLVGDFNEVKLEPSSFDVVVLSSTIEHIGLVGRYDGSDEPDGDLRAMSKVNFLLKDDGLCVLTIPLGTDAVFAPWHRVYGCRRLPILLEGFDIVRSRFFAKRPWDKWYQVTEEEALAYPATVERYAFGLYVLRRARVTARVDGG
jgi:hypothetical protein